MGTKRKAPGTFTEAQVKAASAVKDANSTPKDVLKAFLAGGVPFGALKLPPLDLARFMALEAVDSPLIDPPDAKRETKASDIATALVLLTSTLEDCRRLVNDVEELEQLVWKFASRIPISEMIAAGKAIGQVIAQGFSTVIGSEKKTVKTGSPKVEDPDSAGG